MYVLVCHGVSELFWLCVYWVLPGPGCVPNNYRVYTGLASFPGRKIFRHGPHCFAHACYSQENLGISARLNIFRLLSSNPPSHITLRMVSQLVVKVDEFTAGVHGSVWQHPQARPTTETSRNSYRRCKLIQWEKTRFCSSQLDSASLRVMNCYCRLWVTSEREKRVVVQHWLYQH